MSLIVLDASAVLALVHGEPGADAVEEVIGQAVISAVNVQEVAKDLLTSGLSIETAQEIVDALRLDIRDHNSEAAFAAAALHAVTRQYGRGLGDRSCMALGIALGCPVMTADREWKNVTAKGLEIVFLR